MSVTVVAVLTAKPGLGSQVIESFREVSSPVHSEPGPSRGRRRSLRNIAPH